MGIRAKPFIREGELMIVETDELATRLIIFCPHLTRSPSRSSSWAPG